jgi:hypothetical protein
VRPDRDIQLLIKHKEEFSGTFLRIRHSLVYNTCMMAKKERVLSTI